MNDFAGYWYDEQLWRTASALVGQSRVIAFIPCSLFFSLHPFRPLPLDVMFLIHDSGGSLFNTYSYIINVVILVYPIDPAVLHVAHQRLWILLLVTGSRQVGL